MKLTARVVAVVFAVLFVISAVPLPSVSATTYGHIQTSSCFGWYDGSSYHYWYLTQASGGRGWIEFNLSASIGSDKTIDSITFYIWNDGAGTSQSYFKLHQSAAWTDKYNDSGESSGNTNPTSPGTFIDYFPAGYNYPNWQGYSSSNLTTYANSQYQSTGKLYLIMDSGDRMTASVLFNYYGDHEPDWDATTDLPYVSVTYHTTVKWAPTFTSSPTTSVNAYQAYSYTVTANETVTWTSTSTNASAWLTWGAANHTWYGRAPLGPASYYVRTQATSTAGTLAAWQNFTLTVNRGYWAPTFTSSAVTSVKVYSAYSYSVTWNESISDWSISTNWTGLHSTTGNHTIWGRMDGRASYYVKVNATSTAGLLVGWQNYTITVWGWAPHVDLNYSTWDFPVVTGQHPIGQGRAGFLYKATLYWNDTINVTTATYTTNASWLDAFGASGHYQVMNNHDYPAGTDVVAGVYSVSMSAVSTSGGLRAYYNFTLTVTLVDVTPPVANAGNDQSGVFHLLVYFDGQNSTDNIGVTNWTWTFTYNSSARTLYGETNTYDMWATGSTNVVVVVTLTVRDAANNSDTDTFVATIYHREYWRPTFTSTPSNHVMLNQPYSYVVTWNESVTSVSISGSGTVWLTYTNANHTVWGRGTPTGTYTITVSATSVSGTLVGTQTFNVYVQGPSASAGYFGWLSSSGLWILFGLVGLVGMISTPAYYLKYKERNAKSLVMAIAMWFFFFALFYAAIVVNG